MLGRVILDAILTFITLGIYLPWAINGDVKYVCDHVRVENPPSGTTGAIEYTGKGVELFGRFILWYILTIVTLGLYTPWMLNGFYRYVVENIRVQASAASA